MVRVVTRGNESVRAFFPVSATKDAATVGGCSGTGGKMTASRATTYQGIGRLRKWSGEAEPLKQKRQARTALLDACLTNSRGALEVERPFLSGPRLLRAQHDAHRLGLHIDIPRGDAGPHEVRVMRRGQGVGPGIEEIEHADAHVEVVHAFALG